MVDQAAKGEIPAGNDRVACPDTLEHLLEEKECQVVPAIDPMAAARMCNDQTDGVSMCLTTMAAVRKFRLWAIHTFDDRKAQGL